MAINLTTQYPDQVDASTPEYPLGKARNVTSPDDNFATPLDAGWMNDHFGFFQALLTAAGIVPSGSPDTATSSQYLDAIKVLAGSGVAVYYSDLKSSAGADGAYTVVKSREAGGDTRSGGIFVWFTGDMSSNVTADALEGVYVAPSSDPTGASGAWKRVFSGSPSPLWWGAVTDGVNNDTVALRGYHEYCNATRSAADYSGLEKIAIDADAQISVNTDWDLRGVPLKILNGLAEHPPGGFLPSYLQRKTYIIEDPDTPEETRSGVVLAANRKAGSSAVAAGLFDGAGYVKLTDPNTLVSDRAATGTTGYTQTFHVIRDGKSTQPLSSDIDGTAVTALFRLDSGRGALTIRNINLLADGGWNHLNLLSVNRNQVKVRGFTMTHTADAVAPNVSSVIKVNNASDFGFYAVSSKGVEYGGTGTYVLNVNGCADLYLGNVDTATGWGWIGTNHVNGLYAVNCSVMRIDGHESMHNVHTMSCTFYDRGVTIGWGGGVVRMTDTTLVDSYAFYGRSDYGSSFDGDISINGVRLIRLTGDPRPIFNSLWTGNPTLPTLRPARNISVTGVTLAATTDSSKRDAWLVDMRPADNGATVYAPHSVTVDNVRGASDANVLMRVDFGGYRNWITSGLNISGINARSFNLSVTSTNTINHASNPTRVIANLSDITTFVGTQIDSVFPINRLDSDNVSPLTKLTVPLLETYGVKSAISVTRSKIFNYAGAQKIGNTSSSLDHYTHIYNCTTDSGADLSGVGALQGTHIRNAVTLPATATVDTAFTGWRL